jgi:hypothetical protein
VFLRFGVHFLGCGAARFSSLLSTYRLLIVCLSKSRRRWFCGGFWVPSLETDAVLDAALSGDCFTMAIGVSVRAVQEKCDEKEQGNLILRLTIIVTYSNT